MAIAEWQTKSLGIVVASGFNMFADHSSGRRNPFMDLVEDLSIWPRELSEEEKELERMRGERVADSLEDDPRFQGERMVEADPDNGVEASNPGGSFEALMGGWLPSSHGQALQTPEE